ncbi:hypothetical protein [Amphibacillus sediminis]|uniref:hypothetical protein n=1 Tax=Amphibacillus sediminis TaxID=360185 RepID=UPI0008345E2C|nr:hypothetical protein [Amphibacillus sediminis]
MKKLRVTTDLKDSLIPLGMMSGCAIGVILGIFINPALLVYTVSIGTGIGYLLGVMAFAILSQ